MPTGDEGTKCSSCLLPYNNKDRTPKVWQCMLLCSKQMYNVHIPCIHQWTEILFVFRAISTMTNLSFDLNQRTSFRNSALISSLKSHTCLRLKWTYLLTAAVCRSCAATTRTAARASSSSCSRTAWSPASPAARPPPPTGRAAHHTLHNSRQCYSFSCLGLTMLKGGYEWTNNMGVAPSPT